MRYNGPNPSWNRYIWFLQHNIQPYWKINFFETHYLQKRALVKINILLQDDTHTINLCSTYIIFRGNPQRWGGAGAGGHTTPSNHTIFKMQPKESSLMHYNVSFRSHNITNEQTWKGGNPNLKTIKVKAKNWRIIKTIVTFLRVFKDIQH